MPVIFWAKQPSLSIKKIPNLIIQQQQVKDTLKIKVKGPHSKTENDNRLFSPDDGYQKYATIQKDGRSG
jgi:hypothetical protein